MPFKSIVKRSLRQLGYKIEKIDALEESVPADYNHSPFLPQVYRGALDRYLYSKDMVKKVQDVDGDIVECSVSPSHGALLHLDCDLYESHKLSLENLYGKIQPGGVIMFEEYGDTRWPGASKAIDVFLSDKPEHVQPHSKCT